MYQLPIYCKTQNRQGLNLWPAAQIQLAELYFVACGTHKGAKNSGVGTAAEIWGTEPY